MRCFIGALVSALLVSPTALAQSTRYDSERSGIELGVRLGYGIPAGRIGRPLDMSMNFATSDVVTGQAPIWIDAGYRFTPNLYAGLMFQYGLGFANETIISPCEGYCIRTLRIGVGAAWHLSPAAAFDPWVGLAAGYEWLYVSQSVGDSTNKGFELANIQLGGDFALGRGFGIGPFMSVSLGRYSTLSGTGVFSGTSSYVETAIHEWIIIGVRGIFDFRI